MDRARGQAKSPQVKRWAIAAAVVVVLVIAVILVNVDFGSHRVDRDRVSIESVERGTLEIRVGANGKLQSENIEQFAARVSGRVAKLHVKPGARVEAKQMLVELTNPELLAKAEEAQSEWEGAMQELQAARAELQTSMLSQQTALVEASFNHQKLKLQQLAESRLVNDHRIISEVEYQRTVLNVAQAEKLQQIQADRLRMIRGNIKVQLAVLESRVTQRARALDRATEQVANLRIVAGIDGIVQAIDVQVGQQLLPGSPIGRVAQQDDLYAELRVPAREAADVRVGQDAVIDTRSGIVKGVVARIDPGVTDGAVIVDVELHDTLPAAARPLLQVEGTIYIDRIADALYVGKPAYVKANSALMVYKLDPGDNYARQATIRTGKVSLSKVQVLAGLAVGDRIITSETSAWREQKRILLK
jgi:HlyD family secretion protein